MAQVAVVAAVDGAQSFAMRTMIRRRHNRHYNLSPCSLLLPHGGCRRLLGSSSRGRKKKKARRSSPSFSRQRPTPFTNRPAAAEEKESPLVMDGKFWFGHLLIASCPGAAIYYILHKQDQEEMAAAAERNNEESNSENEDSALSSSSSFSADITDQPKLALASSGAPITTVATTTAVATATRESEGRWGWLASWRGRGGGSVSKNNIGGAKEEESKEDEQTEESPVVQQRYSQRFPGDCRVQVIRLNNECGTVSSFDHLTGQYVVRFDDCSWGYFVEDELAPSYCEEAKREQEQKIPRCPKTTTTTAGSTTEKATVVG